MTQSRGVAKHLTVSRSGWRYPRVRVPFCLALVCSLMGMAATAEPGRVVILLGKSYPQYQQVASAFSQEWKEATGTEPEVVTFPTDPAKREQLLSKRPTLVVGLGEQPTTWALGRDEGFDLAFTMVVGPRRIAESNKTQAAKHGRLTCVSIEVPEERQLDILLQLFPNLKRVGVLTHDATLQDKVNRLGELCEKRQLQLVHKQLSSLTELPTKLNELFGQADLIWSLPDPEVFQPQLAQHIIVRCSERNIPLLGLSATFVKSGATISFDPDYQEVGRLLARQCLSRTKESGADLLITSPQRIVVSINQRAFTALNLTPDIKSSDVTVAKY